MGVIRIFKIIFGKNAELMIGLIGIANIKNTIRGKNNGHSPKCSE